MRQLQRNPFRAMAVLCLLFGLTFPAFAAETKYNAVVTFCSGRKAFVTDFRIIYSWRQMPAHVEGLTTYEVRTLPEQGVWVVSRTRGKAAFELVPFRELASIEFDSDLRQLGVSSLYQLQIHRVRLNRLDGKSAVLSNDFFTADAPVLWPHAGRARFPEDLGDKQIDRIDVFLRGKTKIEGHDSEFLVVLSRPTNQAIESVIRKGRDTLPCRIEIQPAPPESSATVAGGR